jgi:hypothetical protein
VRVCRYDKRSKLALPCIAEPQQRVVNPSGWKCFVESQVNGSWLKTLGPRWKAMTDEERDPYKQKAQRLREDSSNAPAIQNVPIGPQLNLADFLPCRVGDLAYPIDAEDAAALIENCSSLCTEWVEYVGTLVSPDLSFQDAETKQCCDVYGVGVCKEDFTIDEIKRFVNFKRYLQAVSKLHVDKPLDIPLKTLIHFKPQGDGDGMLVLLLCTLLCPLLQVYLQCSCDGNIPALGYIATLNLSLGDLLTEKEIALWCVVMQSIVNSYIHAL